jgi:hypothetical protein
MNMAAHDLDEVRRMALDRLASRQARVFLCGS